MKTKLFIILLTGIFYVSIYGQVDFGFHEITDNAVGACGVFAADINDDGHMDVLSASYLDNTIAWWENDGEVTPSFARHNIISDAIGAITVFAADIDDDGDMDVVAASNGDDTIAWWENDGQQPLPDFTRHIITTDADGVFHIDVEDINDDGHLDIVAGCYVADTVEWWENDGEVIPSFTKRDITTMADGVRSVYAADFDNDGDMDVLSASRYDGKVAWYENLDGQGNFGSQEIIFQDPIAAWKASPGDINDDGHMDVVANVESGTVWFQNDGEVPPFFIVPPHTVLLGSGSDWLFPYDIDDDGDEDIVDADWFANKVGYHDNMDGQGGDFEARWLDMDTVNWSAPNCVYVEDLDGDTDYDIVSSWEMSSHIIWHENKTIDIGLEDNLLSDFSVYPIPTTGILNIQSETAITQIEVYDLLGQLVILNTDQNTIDISSASLGLYFLKIMDENGNMGTQKIVKN